MFLTPAATLKSIIRSRHRRRLTSSKATKSTKTKAGTSEVSFSCCSRGSKGATIWTRNPEWKWKRIIGARSIEKIAKPFNLSILSLSRLKFLNIFVLYSDAIQIHNHLSVSFEQFLSEISDELLLSYLHIPYLKSLSLTRTVEIPSSMSFLVC